MHSNSNLFCISAGQIAEKKSNSVFSRKHRYLNYGLLKLASLIDKNQYRPIVIHGLFSTPEEIFGTCLHLGLANTRNPILISIPSFFALGWAKEFAQYVKKSFPNRKIIIGGRWVLGSDPKWLYQYLPVDLVVPGLVNNEITSILDTLDHKVNVLADTTPPQITTIDYNLLFERHLFQPSIEVSSGCGFGCAFCEERNISLSKLKSAEMIATEMEKLSLQDGLTDISPYFESSMFVASEQWVAELEAERNKRNISTQWRTESRVDKLKARNIPALARAGLKVIDLGLESASHTQLRRMRKTDSPEKYLDTAAELIQVAHENGIWVKANILFYGGETLDSIDETARWMTNIKSYIKGVSVGPVIGYGIDSGISNFITEMASHGATPVNSGIKGVTYFNLSSEIDHNYANSISMEISRQFMTAKDFFDLKSFSYFSRDYKYPEFLDDLKTVSAKDISFQL